ncbi:MAG: hypothetical protein O6758_02515 [Planctomycetota bacterium]|nr:hypothetical protein [Planctomycetota bacterium]
MSGSDLAYWLMWLLGLGLLGLCTAVTWWGLFGDRARGRRRCPRCWYDLSHTPGMTCPECGLTATGERSLHKTRRRWVPAGAAALVAALGSAWTIEQAQQGGWVSLLPTTLILGCLPMAGSADGGLISELTGRMASKQLTEGQWRALIGRSIKGDWRARPVTERWQEKYGVLLGRRRNVFPPELDLDSALLDLPAWVDVRIRRPWPKDTPLCLELAVRDWWPSGTSCRVQLTPKWNGAEPITVTRSPARRGARRFPIIINVPSALSPLRFDVSVQRRGPEPDAAWEVVHRQTISVPIEVNGELADMLRPVRDEKLDQAVMDAFAHGVVKWTSGRSPVRVRFDHRPTLGIAFNDIAIGASIELLYDGAPARRLDIWWLAGEAAAGRRGVNWLVVHEDVPLLMQANETDGRWQMRVRGDPALALRSGPASRYWAGQFTIPLVVQSRNRPAPPRDWRLE